MLDIKIDKSAEEIGLADMLTNLIRQNVDQHSERNADFNSLDGSIAIEAKDAEVTLTLEFHGGSLEVYGGIKGKPDVIISTDSSVILELNNAKLLFGLPDVTDPTGRAVFKRIFSGELKLKGSGLILKPGLLGKFSKLLSVNVDDEVKVPPEEKVVYKTGLHWLVFFWPVVLTIAAVATLSAGKGMISGGVVLCVVAAIWWLASLRRHSGAGIEVTERRVILRRGFIRKVSIATMLSDVDKIGVDQGIKGRLFGCGTITISCTGGREELFYNIAKPRELGMAIMEQKARSAGESP